jgi:hypothetical protein
MLDGRCPKYPYISILFAPVKWMTRIVWDFYKELINSGGYVVFSCLEGMHEISFFSLDILRV